MQIKKRVQSVRRASNLLYNL